MASTTGAPDPLTVKSVSVTDLLPLNALPVGRSALVALDAYTTETELTIDDSARWVLYSGTTDFIVASNTQASGGNDLPATLPSPGTPAGDGSLLFDCEINPGLRAIGSGTSRKVKIKGISATGYVSVSYYA